MYTRRPDDRQPVPPENYAGTLFHPQNQQNHQNQQNRQNQPDCQKNQPEKQPVCLPEAQNEQNCEQHHDQHREPQCDHFEQQRDRFEPQCDRFEPQCDRFEPPCKHERPREEHQGLLGGLLSRFGNFELDDLLLLGLIFLLSSNRGNDCENSDDLLLILGLLLFMGF